MFAYRILFCMLLLFVFGSGLSLAEDSNPSVQSEAKVNPAELIRPVPSEKTVTEPERLLQEQGSTVAPIGDSPVAKALPEEDDKEQPSGEITENGWAFVIAAYGLSWLGLLGYLFTLYRRGLR